MNLHSSFGVSLPLKHAVLRSTPQFITGYYGTTTLDEYTTYWCIECDKLPPEDKISPYQVIAVTLDEPLQLDGRPVMIQSVVFDETVEADFDTSVKHLGYHLASLISSGLLPLVSTAQAIWNTTVHNTLELAAIAKPGSY